MTVDVALPPPNEDAISAQSARNAAREDDEKARKKRGPYKPRKKAALLPGAVDVREQACRKAGRAAADALVALGITLGGEDWKTAPPVLDADGSVVFDERETLREAWGDLFVEYGWERMPAWAACAIATASYAAPRMFAPSTKARLNKFQLWWQSRKLKAEAKRQGV